LIVEERIGVVARSRDVFAVPPVASPSPGKRSALTIVGEATMVPTWVTTWVTKGGTMVASVTKVVKYSAKQQNSRIPFMVVENVFGQR
jgi:hypothetical protein